MSYNINQIDELNDDVASVAPLSKFACAKKIENQEVLYSPSKYKSFLQIQESGSDIIPLKAKDARKRMTMADNDLSKFTSNAESRKFNSGALSTEPSSPVGKGAISLMHLKSIPLTENKANSRSRKSSVATTPMNNKDPNHRGSEGPKRFMKLFNELIQVTNHKSKIGNSTAGSINSK